MVNYLAVFVSAALSMVLGFAWYSPALFGKPWLAAMGLTPESMTEAKKKGMAKVYFSSFIGSLVMAAVFAMFSRQLAPVSAAAGVVTGFWLWLGFVAPVMLNDVLYGKSSLKLYTINAGYQLVLLMVVGAILAAWR